MMHLTGLILATSSAVLFVNATPDINNPVQQQMTINQTQLTQASSVQVASSAELKHNSRVREALKRHPNQSTSRQRRQAVPLTAGSYSLQQTSVNLRTKDLRQPCLLTIEPASASTKLTGMIKLNGKRLLTLNGKRTELNLAKFLKKGKNKVEVVGSYSPRNADVEISFDSPSGEVVQAVGGSGKINQVITLNID